MGWRDAPAVETQQSGARWQTAPVNQARPKQSLVGGLTDQFLQGATFGFGDELTGVEAGVLGRTPEGGWFDYSQPFEERRRAGTEAERANYEAFQRERPLMSAGAQIAGAMATGGAAGLGRAVMRAPTAARAMMAGAAEGGLAGSVAGAGYAEGGPQGRAEGAAWGAGVGAITGGAGSAITNRLTRSVPRPQLPGAEALSQATNTAYQAVDDLGVVYRPEAINGLVDNLSQTATASGLRPQLHTTLQSFLRSLEVDRSKAMTPSQVELIRRQLRGAVINPAVRAGDDDTARIGFALMNEIDSFMERASANQVIAGRGNVGQALESMRAARSAAHREGRAELVANALQRARDRADVSGTGGNYNNTVRQELLKLVTNKSTAGLFNAEEKAAIRAVASGDPIDRVLRVFAAVSPERSGIMAWGSGAAGLMGAAGGPDPLMAIPATGFVANRALNARQAARVRDVQELVQRGLLAQPPQAVGRTRGLLSTGTGAYTGGIAGEAATASRR